jgi:hypothetical protein
MQESSARVADYYQQRGVAGPELSQQTGTVLGTFAHLESVARGVQAGFGFLSVFTGGVGVLVGILLWASMRAAKTP